MVPAVSVFPQEMQKQTDANRVSGENGCFCCGEHSKLSGDGKQKCVTADLKKRKLELGARDVILPLAEQLDGASGAVSAGLWGQLCAVVLPSACVPGSVPTPVCAKGPPSVWWAAVCEFVCSWMLLEIKTGFVAASCCEWGSEALGLLYMNRKKREALLPSHLGWSHPFLSAPPASSRGAAPNPGPCARPPLVEGAPGWPSP